MTDKPKPNPAQDAAREKLIQLLESKGIALCGPVADAFFQHILQRLAQVASIKQ